MNLNAAFCESCNLIISYCQIFLIFFEINCRKLCLNLNRRVFSQIVFAGEILQRFIELIRLLIIIKLEYIENAKH